MRHHVETSNQELLMERLLGKHWHHLPEAEVLELLETNLDSGLDLLAYKERFDRIGPNAITPPKGKSAFTRFMLQFHQPLVYVLIVSGIVTLALGKFVDSSVILAVVVLNALIGFFQEEKAVKAIDALAKAMKTEATVLRSGEVRRISAEELTLGDVVLVASGDKIPADMRLIQVKDLRVDESALTGESVPVEKHPAPLGKDVPVSDRKNMAYASALVAYGQSRGVVVGVGDDTEIGRISKLISQTPGLETPLTRKMAKVSGVMLWAILALAAITFAVGAYKGEPLVDMFMAAVALAIGAIPEGLPAAVTVILAIGVARMAGRHAIIRKLPAVETLGGVTVVCTDKTGTLTKNEMTVVALYADGVRFAVEGVGYDPEGAFSPSADASQALSETLLAGLLCNDAQLRQTDGLWAIEGDPTEGALVVAAAKAGLSPREDRTKRPRLDAVPFESEHQYMATLHESSDNRFTIAYVKGGVEAVLPKCVQAVDAAGGAGPLDRAAVEAEVERLALQGMRVLVLARKDFEAEKRELRHEDVAEGLLFLGLAGMIDPPRPEATQAVAVCKKAGVRVKMITGDHAVTALAIAKQMGVYDEALADSSAPAALTGAEMARMDDKTFIAAAKSVSVFARVAPEQKFKLVEALQYSGEIVAMTGDGVNDAPALKAADIGVAMGKAGTEAAKEAADMILTDDNFASIAAAVEEGRAVLDNLIKFLGWALPVNIGTGLVILASVFTGATLPVLPAQVLWINMTSAGLLGLSLAFEPREPGVMDRPPRDPRKALLPRPLQFRMFFVGVMILASAFGFFNYELARGMSLDYARTAAVNTFILIETAYLFNCRSLTKSIFEVGLLSNMKLVYGALLMIGAQIAFTHVGFFNRLFQSAPISLESWGLIVAASLAAFVLVGLEKRLTRRWF